MASPFASAEEQGGRGLHKKIYATPVAGKIKIDGDLSDWDLSGQILSYVIPQTMDRQSAKITMMYDDQALYVSGNVRDESPMMNRHDPEVDPRKAWNADVCQIFFSLDPDAQTPLAYSSFKKEDAVSPVATMYLWYFTDRNEPNMAMYHGMKFKEPVHSDWHADGLIPRDKFDAAYIPTEDGKGYTFEYRIPFDTLALKRVPKAGDDLAACVCVFWSRPDGLETAGASAWVNDVMSKPGFPFQEAACWGSLTFSQTGNLPRVMVEGRIESQMAKLLEMSYQLPQAGQITLQLVDENKKVQRILHADTQRAAGSHHENWDGLDDLGKPLPAGRYDVQMLIHDPIEAQWRLSVNNSGNPPWPTDDNTGGWGGDHGSPTTTAALNDGMLLAWSVSEFGWGIIRTDIDGRKKWGSKHNAEFLAVDGDRFFASGGHGFHLGADVVRVFAVEDGRPVSLGNGEFVLHLPQSDVEQQTPKHADDEQDQTNAVTGLACHAHRVYVAYASRNVVAVFDANTGELLQTWDVTSPRALTITPQGKLIGISQNKLCMISATGTRLLAENHLDQPAGVTLDALGQIYVANQGQTQAVSVFDANGKFLRYVGKLGGRPAKGTYDPKGMYMPGGMSIDAHGRLWVAETLDGPKRISVWDTNTGQNLKEFFGGSAYFGYGYIDPKKPSEIYAHHVLWGIDWDQYQGKPLTTTWRKTSPNMIEAPNPSGYQGTIQIMTADNGQQFLWGGGQGKRILSRRVGDLFKPFVCMMATDPNYKRYKGQDIPLIDDDPQRYAKGNYFWQDANNDQCVQHEEVTALPSQFKRISIAYMDPDLNLVFTTGHRLKPHRLTDEGQPVYDISKIQSTFLSTGRHANYAHVYLWGEPDGTSYTASNNAMQGYTPDGKLKWEYTNLIEWRKALDKPIVGPGRLWGMTGPMGVVNDYFGMMTYFGVNHLFTRDGVYVTALLKDERLGILDANNGQPEGQGGQFVKLRIQDKDRYFIIHGGQDTRVWEVTGLDTVKKLPTFSYTITQQQAQQVQEELVAYQQSLTGQGRLQIVHGRDAMENARPVKAMVDEQRQFEARVAYDDENLYLRYDVKSPSPLLNQFSDEQLIFKGGNLIDLQMGTDPNADASRKTPAPGDVRLLISMRDGKPIAMCYRPKVAGFTGKSKLFTSPTGQESFDRITSLSNVTVKLTQRDEGFDAELAIPLNALGWTPVAGQTVQMDLGYIFGNKLGTATAARAYWHNRGFSAFVTNDIPNESRLLPDQWGAADVKP